MERKWWVLSTVACGTFMATLDSSIVNIALPTLTKALHADIRQIKWVVVIYLLTITVTLLPLGKLSDTYGRRRLFQMGFLVFSASSLLCGLAQTLNILMAARIVQGLGAAMLMANGPAVVTSTFGVRERGRALGVLSMVVSVGLVSGPSFGGFMISHFGWRSIFLINVPVGLVGFYFAKRYLERSRPRLDSPPFDWGGAFIQALLLPCFLLFVDPPTMQLLGRFSDHVSRVVLFIACGILGFVFFSIQKQVPSPLLDLNLFKIRNFWAANLANFLNFISYSSLLVLMPFYLEEVLFYDPERAGYFMSVIPLTVFFVAPISGWLCDRFGSRTLSILGTGIGGIAMILMAGAFGGGLKETSSPVTILMYLGMIGLASGMFQAPNNVTIMSSIPNEKLGLASAVMAMIRNLGLVTGTGVSAKIFSWRQFETNDFIHSFHVSLGVAGFFAIAAMTSSSLKQKERVST